MKNKTKLIDNFVFAIFILLLIFVSTFFAQTPNQTQQNTYSATAPDSSTNWLDSSSTYDTAWDGEGTESDPYLISSEKELAGLSYRVKNGENFSGIYFSQTTNLDMDNHYFTPIGGNDGVNFSGHYNGGSYTITGLFTESSCQYAGLFGRASGAELSNIAVIADSYIRGTLNVGGIVGYITDSTLYNCVNTATIFSNGSSNVDIGGIIGRGVHSNISACLNNGQVSSTNVSAYINVGGIIGEITGGNFYGCYNSANISTTYSNVPSFTTGGVAGYVNSSESNPTVFNRCYNVGNISSSSIAGGVVGWSRAYVYIEDCFNTGTISCTRSSGHTFSRPKASGGIVGFADITTTESITNYSQLINVIRCYNTGSVSGGNSAGGIIGYTHISRIANCFNAGSVSGGIYNGGILGYNYGGPYGNIEYEMITELNHCYYGGNCTLSSFYGGYRSGDGQLGVVDGSRISSLNSSSYAKREGWYTTSSNWLSSEIWDFDEVWTIDSGTNDGYPFLREFIYTIEYEYDSNYITMGSYHPTTAYPGAIVQISQPQLLAGVQGMTLNGWRAEGLNIVNARYGSTSSNVTSVFTSPMVPTTAQYFKDLALHNVKFIAEVDVVEYNVVVVYGNGTSNRTILAEYGTAFNLPVPVRTGYEFQGWRISGTYSLSSALQGVSLNPTTEWTDTTSLPTSTYFSNLAIVDGATVTLTAQWAIGRYDITYNVNASNAQYVGLNYALRTTDANFSDSGISISYDATDGLLTYNGTAQVAGTIGPSLEFEGEIPSIANFVVGYYRMDGSVVTLDRAQTNFWVFFSWNNGTYNDDEAVLMDSGYAIEQDVFTMPTSSTVINRVAVYLVGSLGEKGYTYNNARYRFFIYDENYSGDNTQQILYGDTPAMGYAIRPGYIFTGWNTRANGSGTTYGPDNIGTITSDITLYAQWDKATYTVTFDANGGTAELDRMDVEYLATFGSGNGGELPLAEKDGYIFKGWYLGVDSDEEVTASTIYTYTDNITLYAQWEETWYDYGVKPEGEGTESSPYLIALPEHLAWLTNQVAKGNEAEAYCRQIANIDMSNTKNISQDKTLEWFPIGTDSHPFKGNYNGNGYSLRITSSGTQSNYYGLFGVTESATIEKIYFIGNNFTSGRTSGGVVAYAKGSTTVKDSYIELSLQRKIDTSSFTFGAIIGNGESGSIIENCSLVYFNSLSTEYPVANGDVEIRSVVYRYSKGDGNFDNLYIGTDFSGFSYVPYWTMPLPKNLTHLPTEEVTLEVIESWAGQQEKTYNT